MRRYENNKLIRKDLTTLHSYFIDYKHSYDEISQSKYNQHILELSIIRRLYIKKPFYVDVVFKSSYQTIDTFMHTENDAWGLDVNNYYQYKSFTGHKYRFIFAKQHNEPKRKNETEYNIINCDDFYHKSLEEQFDEHFKKYENSTFVEVRDKCLEFANKFIKQNPYKEFIDEFIKHYKQMFLINYGL